MNATAIPMPAGAVPADGSGAGAMPPPAFPAGKTIPMPTGAVSADVQADPSVEAAPVSSVGTISAVHEPKTWIGKFARWTENVSNDIKYGTDETGIGTVLKKMGAHGVYAGNSEAIGDFMASLPLGLLKAAHGASVMQPESLGGPKGKTWQGLEEVLSGGLQAMTIPSAFIAPEVAEGTADLAGRATGAVGDAVTSAVATGRKIASEVSQGAEVAQPGAQEAIRTAVGAKNDQPIIEGGKSVVDDLIHDFDQMRRELYSQASEKAGFDVRQAKAQLESARIRLGLTEGTESADIASQAKTQIEELENKLSTAHKADPRLMRAADQAHAKYNAAVQFRTTLAKATDVDGTVDVDALLDASKNLRFTKGGDQLARFLGTDGADEFMQDLEHMRDIGAHAVKMQKLAKWVAKIAGGAAVLEGVSAARGAL